MDDVPALPPKVALCQCCSRVDAVWRNTAVTVWQKDHTKFIYESDIPKAVREMSRVWGSLARISGLDADVRKLLYRTSQRSRRMMGERSHIHSFTFAVENGTPICRT